MFNTKTKSKGIKNKKEDVFWKEEVSRVNKEEKSKPKKLQSIIKAYLKEYPETRGNDHLLYANVFQYLYGDVLNYYNFTDKILSFESISRLRRKVQEEYPELTISDMTKNRRMKEEAYREYYGKKRR